MKKIALLFFLTFITILFPLSSCKKKAAEIPVEQEDPRIEPLRIFIKEKTSIDLKGVKPEISFADFKSDDRTFVGKDAFTLEKTQGLPGLLMQAPTLYVDTKPYVTLLVSQRIEIFTTAGLLRVITLASTPQPGGGVKVEVGESIRDFIGGDHRLWMASFLKP